MSETQVEVTTETRTLWWNTGPYCWYLCHDRETAERGGGQAVRQTIVTTTTSEIFPRDQR